MKIFFKALGSTGLVSVAALATAIGANRTPNTKIDQLLKVLHEAESSSEVRTFMEENPDLVYEFQEIVNANPRVWTEFAGTTSRGAPAYIGFDEIIFEQSVFIGQEDINPIVSDYDTSFVSPQCTVAKGVTLFHPQEYPLTNPNFFVALIKDTDPDSDQAEVLLSVNEYPTRRDITVINLNISLGPTENGASIDLDFNQGSTPTIRGDVAALHSVIKILNLCTQYFSEEQRNELFRGFKPFLGFVEQVQEELGSVR